MKQEGNYLIIDDPSEAFWLMEQVVEFWFGTEMGWERDTLNPMDLDEEFWETDYKIKVPIPQLSDLKDEDVVRVTRTNRLSKVCSKAMLDSYLDKAQWGGTMAPDTIVLVEVLVQRGLWAPVEVSK